MDINLPEAELSGWVRHLSRYFNNLQDVAERFAPASRSTQVHEKKC
jgi:hypothetical protein